MNVAQILTPIGVIEVIANDKYVKRIYLREDLKDIDKLNQNSNKITELAIKELGEYFQGIRLNFTLPLELPKNFKGLVYSKLSNNYYGKTLSYAKLAYESNNSKAYRAVGSAMSSNPYMIVIPCHRVIKTDGSLGNYFYGLKIKKWLIDHEEKVLTDQKLKKFYHFSKEDLEKLNKNKYLKNSFIEIKSKYMSYSDPFMALVIPIIHQQISYKVALSIESKFLKAFNYSLSPKALKYLPVEEYRKYGISASKASYIINIATFWDDNKSKIEMLIKEKNFKELEKELITIKGVGPWTIEVFLLFGLNHPNILPTRDLIIANGLKKILQIENLEGDIFESFKNSIKGIETLVSLNIWNMPR